MNWNLRIALGLVGMLALMFLLLWALGATTRADIPENAGAGPAPVPGPNAPPPDGKIRSDFELTREDAGESFRYPRTSRFTVLLPEGTYRESDLRCEPEGVIVRASNPPYAPAGYFAVRFDAMREGNCTLRAGSWQTEIFVSAED